MDAEAIMQSDDPVYVATMSAIVQEADKIEAERDKVRARHIANEVAKKF